VNVHVGPFPSAHSNCSHAMFSLQPVSFDCPTPVTLPSPCGLQVQLPLTLTPTLAAMKALAGGPDNGDRVTYERRDGFRASLSDHNVRQHQQVIFHVNLRNTEPACMNIIQFLQELRRHPLTCMRKSGILHHLVLQAKLFSTHPAARSRSLNHRAMRRRPQPQSAVRHYP
jgi:hypothetical protein